MFQRDQILSFYQQVDELDAKIDAGDFGRLEKGYEEHELVSMAAGILQEIADGLSNQTGFTNAQLVVASHALRDCLHDECGVEMTHDELIGRAPRLLRAANDFLNDEDRQKECILSGFLDAHGYWRAATYYADAGMEEQARKCIAGARYWRQRILDNCRA